MLTTLDVPGNGFQDWLLHHLPRDRGEVDQPVVPWVLLAYLPVTAIIQRLWGVAL